MPSSATGAISVVAASEGSFASVLKPIVATSASPAPYVSPLQCGEPSTSRQGAIVCDVASVIVTEPSSDRPVAGGGHVDGTLTLSPKRARLDHAAEHHSASGTINAQHDGGGQVVMGRPLGNVQPLIVAQRHGAEERNEARDPTLYALTGEGRAGPGVVGTAPRMHHDGHLVLGPLSSLAAAGDWDALCQRMSGRMESTLVSGGPGVGKTTFLRKYCTYLRRTFEADGEVVVCASTGSAARTAMGVTYHSFFGFELKYVPQLADPVQEAARLLG